MMINDIAAFVAAAICHALIASGNITIKATDGL